MASLAGALARALLTALLAGTASAFLLWSLDAVGDWFATHRWMVWLLPAVGWLTHWLYRQTGAGGMVEVLADLRDPRERVNWRMAPAVLTGTILTHLCGGSAGREGTAVQAGAALAGRAGADLRVGIAAGFGSVFGTPWAGFLYSFEIAGLRTAAPGVILPCLLGAFVADWVAQAWGAHHTVYRIAVWPAWWAIGWAAAAGCAFGLAAWTYHLFTDIVKRYVPVLLGGAVVAVVLYSTQAWQFSGLGVPEIAAAFERPAAPADWLAKLSLTAITVGSGFRGGEATPLFFVGATLGNTLSGPVGVPMGWLAGLGFVAVFAAATRTPLASTVMAVELFGPAVIPFALAACFSADWAAQTAQRFWQRGSAPVSP
jgi:H+/Cl- antiporter ClcA